MVEEIAGAGEGELDRLSRTGKTQDQSAARKPAPARDQQEPAVQLSGDLRELIDRIRHARTFRKEKVHRVLEKLQEGELVTSETVREAAEKILREGI